MGVRRLERSARRLLDRLQTHMGAGLLAAATIPGLTAVIDQHAAAVRDIVEAGAEPGAAVAGTVLLAGYAQGMLDHVRDRGGQLRVPTEAAGWAHADWVSMRLVAVCALARTLGTGRPLDDTKGLPSLA